MGFVRVAIILIFYDFVCKKRLLNKSYAVKKLHNLCIGKYCWLTYTVRYRITRQIDRDRKIGKDIKTKDVDIPIPSNNSANTSSDRKATNPVFLRCLLAEVACTSHKSQPSSEILAWEIENTLYYVYKNNTLDFWS